MPAHPAEPRHSELLPVHEYEPMPSGPELDAKICPTSPVRGIELGATTHAVRVKVPITVMIGVEAHTHEYIATAHEDQKIGLAPTDTRWARSSQSNSTAGYVECMSVSMAG